MLGDERWLHAYEELVGLSEKKEQSSGEKNHSLLLVFHACIGDSARGKALEGHSLSMIHVCHGI